MTPLLEGTDGLQKMSKSLGNTIGINEPPKEIFGKIMSISDTLMLRYYELLTDFDLAEIKILHPREAKLRLASEIVKQFYGSRAALAQREHFEKTFSQKQIPDDVEEYHLKTGMAKSLVDILIMTHLVESKNEARRLINQGAISHDGNKVESEVWAVQPGILKIGKRRFFVGCVNFEKSITRIF